VDESGPGTEVDGRSGIRIRVTPLGAETGTKLGAGIALAGCGIGTGLGQGQIGAAAVGWVAEDGSKLGLAMLFTVLPETILIFGFLAMFLL